MPPVAVIHEHIADRAVDGPEGPGDGTGRMGVLKGGTGHKEVMPNSHLRHTSHTSYMAFRHRRDVVGPGLGPGTWLEARGGGPGARSFR